MARTPTDPAKAQVWVTKGLDDIDFEFYFPQGPKGDPGGFVSGTLLASTDLNSIKTAGIYRQDSGSLSTALRNYPNFNGGVLTVMEMAGPNFVVQTFFPLTGGTTGARVKYQREFVTPNWSPWRLLTTTRTDQTAGRVIYQWDDVNNREQLIYGDTGWRNVSALLAAGQGTVLGSVRLRRNGNVCELQLNSWQPTVDVANITRVLLTLPPGFRPVSWVNITCPTSSYTIMNSGFLAPDGNLSFRIPANQNLTVDAAFIWSTTQSWPTTLPGSAMDTIPNA